MPADDATHFNPPAPLARVTLRNPSTGATASDVELLVDSGADVTHAAATRVGVRLAVAQSGKGLEIEVSDNGKGFERDRVEPGIGLIGMRERVQASGANSRSEDARTQIRIELPIQ